MRLMETASFLNGCSKEPVQDWVTTEAIGIALQALQTVPVPAFLDFSPPTILPMIRG